MRWWGWIGVVLLGLYGLNGIAASVGGIMQQIRQSYRAPYSFQSIFSASATLLGAALVLLALLVAGCATPQQQVQKDLDCCLVALGGCLERFSDEECLGTYEWMQANGLCQQELPGGADDD